jgi:hypothetical protein
MVPRMDVRGLCLNVGTGKGFMSRKDARCGKSRDGLSSTSSISSSTNGWAPRSLKAMAGCSTMTMMLLVSSA